MAFITSASAAPHDYVVEWEQGPNNVRKPKRTIHINGGSDVINKRTLITPRGVVTEVTEKDIEDLKKDPLFIFHLNNGFLEISGTEKEANKAEKDLEKDKSAQITPDDYENGNEKKEIRKSTRKPKAKKQ